MLSYKQFSTAGVKLNYNYFSISFGFSNFNLFGRTGMNFLYHLLSISYLMKSLIIQNNYLSTIEDVSGRTS